MANQGLQAYLNEHIPMSRAMGVTVVDASPQRVALSAPLAPNINHRDTVFGGSAAAAAMLAAWGLLRVRLETEEDIAPRVVIQHNEMTFEHPIVAGFEAHATLADDAQWPRFMGTLRRKGRGRIAVHVELVCDSRRVAFFAGDFVAVRVQESSAA